MSLVRVWATFKPLSLVFLSFWVLVQVLFLMLFHLWCRCSRTLLLQRGLLFCLQSRGPSLALSFRGDASVADKILAILQASYYLALRCVQPAYLYSHHASKDIGCASV